MNSIDRLGAAFQEKLACVPLLTTTMLNMIGPPATAMAIPSKGNQKLKREG